MNNRIQEKLAIEIANKALLIATLQAENEQLRSQVDQLTAELDQATAPAIQSEGE